MNSIIDGSPEVRVCTQISPLNMAFQSGGRLQEMAATSTIRQMEHDPVIRPTSRVLLLDEIDRVLLFRGEDPLTPTIRYWFPAGGGIEPGESPADAARREVWEETGLVDFELGPHIWNRRHVFTFYGANQDVRELWFFARVHSFEIDTSRFTQMERDVVKEHKWWTQSELASTNDVLTPRALASLVQDLLVNGLPKSPVDVDI
ncbi:MAG TPA: NUDIX domain-containing protein [Candidatus Nanopelagicaceae bacterium]